jgi:PRTRC genetic system protein B
MTKYDKKGHPVSCYEIDPDGLASAFSGVPISSGFLPEGTLFYERRNGNDRIALYLPAQVRKMTVVFQKSATVYTIPVPPLVFLGFETMYCIFAVKERAEQAALYHAPFPNVYPGARICLGTANFPFCSTRTIRDAAELFFESAFNHDLSSNKSLICSTNVIDAWKKLQASQAAEYPLSDLVDAHSTVNRLIESW